MVKWIGAAQEAEKENLGVPVEEEAAHISKWKAVTLAVLFAGQKDKFVHVPMVDQLEVDLMEGLAEMEDLMMVQLRLTWWTVELQLRAVPINLKI